MITRQELIKKYIEYFKKHKHKIIPNASLIPANNVTSLFIGSGMETIIPYFLGQKHPLGNRLVNVQRCIRTIDIDEVGDTFHHTFFEMLGNWSLGDYWKDEAIKMTFEFITKELGVEKEKLAATCFIGNDQIPKDTESEKVYLELKIPKERIAFLNEKSNLWGPVGNTGPCGPNTEIFYWKPNNVSAPKKFNPDDENWLELGNNVLMTYNKNEQGKYIPLKQKNIDFGGGVERIIATLNGFEDNYLADMWQPIIKEIEKISGKKYKGNEKEMRIIADHIKAATLILGGDHQIKPSNTAQGYVLRRLIRRAVRYGKKLEIKENFTGKIAKSVIKIYPEYQELERNHKFILEQLDEEENKFNQTLEKGLKKFNEIAVDKIMTGKEAFLLFQSYGFPIEFTEELAEEKNIKVDLEEYNQEFQKHQDLSRTSSAGMFKSGLADDSEATKKLHTATHLLNEALRKVLGNENVKQKGSNITPERLRFDFSFSRKLTEEEIKQVEDLVNEKIKQGLKVHRTEMPLQQALSSGAQAEFGNKYPEMVSVYTVEDPKDSKKWFSKEICTGPHVDNTIEIGKFKIIKEESSASGIRRIKAIVE